MEQKMDLEKFLADMDIHLRTFNNRLYLASSWHVEIDDFSDVMKKIYLIEQVMMELGFTDRYFFDCKEELQVAIDVCLERGLL
jgi:hypothetical protein